MPEQQLEDYALTSGQMLTWIQEMDGNQPGDPDKAAAAMLKVVESDNPPLRLALGADAVGAIEEKRFSQSKQNLMPGGKLLSTPRLKE